MLRQLSLRNFVLVTQLELDFQKGFTVLTGETGAGKSILIDALQLALGSRGDAHVVREGQERAEISATFDMHNPALTQWLEEAGFQDNGDELLLRRTIDTQGKSRAWINGSSATISQLRELSEFLVDIHGQHAWQGLTKANRVRELLDAYGKIDTNRLQPLWDEWQNAEKKLHQAKQQLERSQTEHERLSWQLSEIEKLSPQKDEWDELNTEHERLSHAQLLIDSAQTARDALSESDRSATDQINHAISTLEKAASIDSSLADIVGILKDAAALVEDSRHSLSNWLRHTDLDPQRLEELDTRMSLWMSLARRYRRKPEELFDLYQQWKVELSALESGSDIDALEAICEKTKQAWYALAQQISKQRLQVAPQLSLAITTAMQSLGMQGGRFEASVTPLEMPQSSGLEQIEFLVAGHAGTTPKPVAKVASGGELSRLALAIAVTTSQLGYTPTLIFDEIDVGIGGAVAQTVGHLMQQLGLDKQVLAVTHLAQVAAYANQHLVVSKQTSEQTDHMVTSSIVHPVSEQPRIIEIARMLSGGAHSQASLAHATEMLDAAQQRC
ncbi:MAG: DNA repair protein RecN [Saezia sp.]